MNNELFSWVMTNLGFAQEGEKWFGLSATTKESLWVIPEFDSHGRLISLKTKNQGKDTFEAFTANHFDYKTREKQIRLYTVYITYQTGGTMVIIKWSDSLGASLALSVCQEPRFLGVFLDYLQENGYLGQA